MDILTIPLASLTPDDYRKCVRLNSRENGQMQWEVRGLRRRKETTARVCLAKEGNLLIGWALSFPVVTGKNPGCYFYVRKGQRGNGIGKKLMREMIREHGKIRVYPHDKQSAVFFAEFRTSITTGNWDTWRIREAQIYRRTGRWTS